MVLVAAICFLLFALTSCSPKYTEPEARRLFGCEVKKETIDSAPPVLIKRDTIIKYDTIPGDTIKLQSPCEELQKMKPSEKRTKKSGKSTAEYGKDSTGNTYFKFTCDGYIQKAEKYREYWLQTVEKTKHVDSATPEKQHWIKQVFSSIYNTIRNVLAILGIVAIIILITKYNKSP
jgi:hypothetical protein